MKKNSILFIFTLFILAWNLACKPQKPTVEMGKYRAVLASPGGELPFEMVLSRVQNSDKIKVDVLNGKEKLGMDDAHILGDSIVIPMDIFEAKIVAKIEENGRLIGYWQKKRSKNSFAKMNFEANLSKNETRFKNAKDSKIEVNGKWKTTFVTDNNKDTTHAIGIFEQKGAELTGTFLTTTGDYRYLAGNISGDSLMLSCFDGTHLYLFRAVMKDKKLIGKFWSGTSSLENWAATKDENATLPNATKLTYLKKGYESLAFKFPDMEGKKIALTDKRFENKVVVVQILGSWCPNCMDESNFLAPWYKKNKERGVEIVGLAYEKSSVLEEAKPRIEKMKERFGISYPIVLAGTNDKDSASASLPMLNKILSFPTTIFIDKKGKVRQIHTGFAGPGTGKYYDELTADFERLIDKLVAEPSPKIK